MEIQWINVTSHPISVRIAGGKVVTLEPSGLVLRAEVEIVRWKAGGFSLLRSKRKGLSGTLPPMQEGVGYIASAVACDEANRQGRMDVFSPAASRQFSGKGGVDFVYELRQFDYCS